VWVDINSLSTNTRTLTWYTNSYHLYDLDLMCESYSVFITVIF
jgi:hypothetical protein